VHLDAGDIPSVTEDERIDDAPASPAAPDPGRPQHDADAPAGAGVTQPTAPERPAPNDDAAGATETLPRGDAGERPIPIGCHPFVFGIVAATIQLVLTIVLMRSC